MATKDEITLLSDISQQLKKLNQTSVRDTLAEREFREQQLSINAGGVGAIEDGAPNFIDAAEDFRRRVKGSITGAIASEKFTASGKRARRSNKEANLKKKLAGVDRKDKRVGLSDLNEKLGLIKVNSDALVFNSISIKKATQDKSELLEIVKWTSLSKVNSDALVFNSISIKKAVQSLASQGTSKGSLFTHDIHTEKILGDSQKATDKRDKEGRKNRRDDKRSLAERLREGKNNIVEKAGKGFGGITNISNIKKGGSGIWLLALRALPALLGAAVVALAVGAIKDFITGWKEDGLAGAIGTALGGHGSGMWNAIKQSFKLGGLGAIIGAAIGTAFFGVGAIPGAIIGGLIGMAIGAITGFFGGEKITAGLKGAGTVISDGWNKATAFIMYNIRRLGEWFYRPGQLGAAAGPHGSTKTEIFGGFISWEPGNFSIGAAWTEATGKIWEFIKSIGKWIYDGEGEGATILGGTFTMPAWFDNVELGVAKVWQALKDFSGLVKSTLINMLPDWLTDHLGWTVNGKTPEQRAAAFRKYNENNPMHPKNFNQNFYMKAKDGTMKTLDEIDAEKGYLTGAASLQAQLAGQQSLDNITKYGKVGSPYWTKLTGITLPSASTASTIAPVTALTDASVNKQAVTIIQHLTVDGSASETSIHNVSGVFPPHIAHASMLTPLNEKF
jgi:hypothetical protein